MRSLLSKYSQKVEIIYLKQIAVGAFSYLLAVKLNGVEGII